MINPRFYHALCEESKKMDTLISEKSTHATAYGKNSFEIDFRNSVQLQAIKATLDKFGFEIQKVTKHSVIAKNDPEWLNYRNELFAYLKPRLYNNATFGEDHVVVEESKFSIVRAQPLLEALGFKVWESGNEIWSVGF